MIDFNDYLEEEPQIKETDPIKIFEGLDPHKGKEVLRDHQKIILSNWHEHFLNQDDTLVKMHTGQGKTIVGLLMLQSSLNQGLGPAVYLCPNKTLVRQTLEEAKAFGISAINVPESSPLPLEFKNSEKILVTTCQKLFNGKSAFGVEGGSKEILKIGSIVMDDAHKCLEIIRDQFSISIEKKVGDKINPIYQKLWNLFEQSLLRQRPGTCEDIKDGLDAVMTVPFWIWNEKIKEVREILSEFKETQLFYTWDFLKNKLEFSRCIFSGTHLEISPRLIPIELIPSYVSASRRIFLSATLSEDGFLVRDLGIKTSSVNNPLMLEDDKYSGERMVVIPALVNLSFTREKIIKWISQYATKHGNFGVVSIVPSGKHAESWEQYGGIITNRKNLAESLVNLRSSISKGDAKKVIVVVNYYDGIDLPDETCRILCLDSMPTHSSLFDKYIQEVRPESNFVRSQLAQRIEQGMGRGIRGDKDWCVVVATGTKLTSFLSETVKSEFLSDEIKAQISIAKKVSEDLKKNDDGDLSMLEDLINQCVNRNDAWKKFYHKKMNEIKLVPHSEQFLKISELEREAELNFQNGQHQKAIDLIRDITNYTKDDLGWYLQLISTYQYVLSKKESMDIQLKAFNENNRLFKPEIGITYSKLASVPNDRTDSIIEWIKQHDDATELILNVRNILDNLFFGISSNTFEEGIDQLGKILGFNSHRPEQLQGEGPDNLWNIGNKRCWLISCKNQVKLDRDFISKEEAGQFEEDLTWFSKQYQDFSLKPIFIHPAKTLNKGAFLSKKSFVITPDKLELLKKNVEEFYRKLSKIPRDSLDKEKVSKALSETHLDPLNINQDYFELINEQ